MSHLLCSQDTRTHVVGELYDTERSYVESLQILVEKYMKPLKSLESNRVLIDSVLVDEIFHSIPEILQHHENFLGSLQDRLSSDWDSSQVIGNVFIDAFTNQRIIDDYTAFINNWKNARQAIKVATQAKPAFERFLEAMSREHRNKLTLDALLIMPVQRIPRYELLIKELIKHTPEDHPDHKPLMEAQRKIHELALKIDRAEKEMIHQEQLRDLEALIDGHVELQHHHRDFIRYDLVTIVSASALAATKKERVLFLFCDLLIMTSIKKKASRRSNLQNAFANSSNDLSLLEGNKFKLLLRMTLDQIEVRLNYDQLQLHQQHKEEQHHFQLRQQNKLIQERRREIEADLSTLKQMESLAATLSRNQRAKLNELINEMLADMKQILASLEANDMQMLSDEQHSTLSEYSAQELYLTPSPASLSSASAHLLPQQPQANNPQAGSNSNLQIATSNQGHSTSPVQPNHHHPQDSSTSLEFLINNNSTDLAGTKESNDLITIDHQGYLIGGSTGQPSSVPVADPLNSQSSNCDSLVVTFASIERRQAFIQAFIEAKQQRYQQKQKKQLQQQQQQQQQHQHGKIFSSSLTLKLAPHSPAPEAGSSQEKRSSALDAKPHQQESVDTGHGQRPPSLSSITPSRISSSIPLQHHIHQPCSSVIVHQMSAPQSLAQTASSLTESGASGAEARANEWGPSSQCTSCSYNLVAEAEKAQLRHNHQQHQHHHHHQLMHQPASHPASLDTVCCHESHTDCGREQRLRISDDTLDRESQRLCLEYNQKMNRQIGLNSVVNLNGCFSSGASNKTLLANSSDADELDQHQSSQATSSGQQQHLIDQMNFNLLLTKCAPKFLVTLPVDFLSTQHPALQFTCSALGRHHSTSSVQIEELKDGGLDNRKSLKCGMRTTTTASSQTVEDNLGQLWLCMSNGYVSHVALVTIKRRELRRLGADGLPEQACGHGASLKNCYSITPVVISAGDICKSHINCAAQVKWSKLLKPNSGGGSCEIHDEMKKPSPLIKSVDEESEPREPPKGEIAPESAISERGPNVLSSQSPPVDIVGKNKTQTPAQGSKEDPGVRLSESAPSSQSPLVSSGLPDSSGARDGSSASTTRLEVPLRATNNGRPILQSKSMHLHHYNHPFNMPGRPGTERKRSIHDEICHRHYRHNNGAKHLNNRTAASTSLQQIPRSLKYHHNHHHHQHPHHLHHQHPHQQLLHLQHNNFNHHSHQHSHHHAHLTHHNKGHWGQQRPPNQHLSNNYRNHVLGHNHADHTHSHQHHHHHHHHHQHNPQRQQQQQQQHQNNSSQLHHSSYGLRHNTVPIAGPRASPERQEAGEQWRRPGSGQFLLPQASNQGSFDAASSTRSDSPVQKCEKVSSLDLGDQQHPVSPKSARPTTPTSLASASMKGFRSARLMRHQASLKTSSILAKLVGGATRRSAYMRRSEPTRDKSSDLDDNDTDTDTGQQQQQQITHDGGPTDTNDSEPNKMKASNSAGHRISRTSSQQLDPAMIMTATSNNNNSSAMISPLSSASSLNSTTSSFTVNSVCASSPNRGSCELLAHSYSTTCCMGAGMISPSTPPTIDLSSSYSGPIRGELCGHRGRSATAPSRPLCDQMNGLSDVLRPADCSLTHHRSFAIIDPATLDSATSANMISMMTTNTLTPVGRAYKVSEILDETSIGLQPDQGQPLNAETISVQSMERLPGGASRPPAAGRKMVSSLWLGCDDGSLIIIDCMTTNDESRSCSNSNEASNNLDPLHSQQPKTFTCGNVHSEIKLSSPICGISTFKEEKVFVALSNGQLAVFSRTATSADDRIDCDGHSNLDSEIGDIWSLTSPEIITVTENDLNSTARLCQIDENFLWYSYGRSIFVLNMETLKVETTIMAPTNDLTLRLTVQAITIDNMELMRNLSGVWVSFKNSHLIQFYDTKSHKLLVEINLFEPINKLLSYGNEIIRQHKTACLKATCLMNYYNEKEQCNTLFVGTSAGIILYLTISASDQLTLREPILDWKPQIASLRHGHSGHVKLLRLIQMDDDQEPSMETGERRHQHETENESNNNSNTSEAGMDNSLYLISGGTGLDIYGPRGEQQNYISQLNSDEDSLNHLMIWQL